MTLSVPSGPTSAGSGSRSRSQSRSTNEDDDDSAGVDNSASTVSERHLPTIGGFSIDMSDFDTTTTEVSGSRGSFPSIHFDRSASPSGSTEEEDGSSGTDDSEFDTLFERDPVTGVMGITATGGERRTRPRTGTMTAGTGVGASTVHPMNIGNANGRTEAPFALGMPSASSVTRTLYIQMEFVERQTLREVRGFRFGVSWRALLDGICRESTKVSRKMKRGGSLAKSWMH